MLIDRPDSPQSLIIAGGPTALVGTDDLLPVITANDSLGGDFLSRINLDLREARHWSYGVSGGFAGRSSQTPYVLGGGVQADKTGESIVALRADVKDFLTTKGITPTEFDQTMTDSIRSLPGNSRHRARCSVRCSRTTCSGDPTTITRRCRKNIVR